MIATPAHNTNSPAAARVPDATRSPRLARTDEHPVPPWTQLRNTESVKGVVIYTGAESKIQMNSASPPVKMSSMTKLCNQETLWIIVLQAAFCLVAAATAVHENYSDAIQCNPYIWGPKNGDLANWGSDSKVCIQDTETGESDVQYFFIKFFNYVLIFTNFVPIAHVLTLDIVKLMQSSFMESDLNMYHEFKDLFGVTQVRHGRGASLLGLSTTRLTFVILPKRYCRTTR